MANPSFTLSIYQKKDDDTKRLINYRQKSKLRYFVLLLAILVVFGCQYCFDNPSALQEYIQENYKRDNNGTEMGQAQFNLLYSLYAFPNCIIPLFGGILIDKIGARVVFIITAGFCVIGQAVFGLGGFINSFGLMIIGRIIFGIGGEVLHASQSTIISTWFSAQQLSLAIGLGLSVPKLGSSLNSVLSPAIGSGFQSEKQGENLNVAMPIIVGFGIMIVSLVFAILLAIFDKRSKDKQTIEHESVVLSNQRKVNKSDGKNMKSQISVRLVTGSQLHKQSKEHAEVQGEHINFSDIKQLPIAFWILIAISMLVQALFIPFLDNGNKYYKVVFNIQQAKQAGIYLIMPYLVSSILVPFMGYAVDKVGRRRDVIIGSCLFIMGTYIFMLLVQTTVSLRDSEFVRWVPSFLLGVCVAIFCTVMVPTVPMLVKPKFLGTSFGLMEMIQNLALGSFPLIAGLIRQSQGKRLLAGFHLQTLFFFLMCSIAVSAAVILRTTDMLKGNKLTVKDFRKTYIKHVLKEQ